MGRLRMATMRPMPDAMNTSGTRGIGRVMGGGGVEVVATVIRRPSQSGRCSWVGCRSSGGNGRSVDLFAGSAAPAKREAVYPRGESVGTPRRRPGHSYRRIRRPRRPAIASPARDPGHARRSRAGDMPPARPGHDVSHPIPRPGHARASGCWPWPPAPRSRRAAAARMTILDDDAATIRQAHRRRGRTARPGCA